MAFAETQFPVNISRGARGGPRRKTQIIALSNSNEERNAAWANSRREYDVAYGVRNADQLATVVAFFEARNAQLEGFRFKDWSDYKSCSPLSVIAGTDQPLGVTDGTTRIFQLVKQYVSGAKIYGRPIIKPVAGTVQVLATLPAGPELVIAWDNPRATDSGFGWQNFSSTGANSALTYSGFVNAYEIGFSGAGRREQRHEFATSPGVKYTCKAWISAGTGSTASLAIRNTGAGSEISGLGGSLAAPTVAYSSAGVPFNVSSTALGSGVYLWSFDVVIGAGLTSLQIGCGNTFPGNTMILYGVSFLTPAQTGPVVGWTVDTATGLITFGAALLAGGILTAGFEYDVPVRFASDMIDVALSFEGLGSIQSIPLIEVRK